MPRLLRVKYFFLLYIVFFSYFILHKGYLDVVLPGKCPLTKIALGGSRLSLLWSVFVPAGQECVWGCSMSELLCTPHHPWMLQGHKEENFYYPAVPPGCRKEPRAQALSSEILQELGLPVIFSSAGKDIFTFPETVQHTSAVAVWNTAWICPLLFLGSAKGLIPWFSHLNGLPKGEQKPVLLPGYQWERWRRNHKIRQCLSSGISYSGARSQVCCSAPVFSVHPHSVASPWASPWQEPAVQRSSTSPPPQWPAQLQQVCRKTEEGKGTCQTWAEA